MIMTETRFITRRATVDDLPQLIPLWQLEQLPADALERRFTEFQVVCDETGRVVAAIGMQISAAHGLLHGESIATPEIGDELRELLWHRLQAIIHNHALERLWTQMNIPFWRSKGFAPASAEQLAALPTQFNENEHHWNVLPLRSSDASAAIDREFARLQSLQQQEKAKLEAFVAWMKRAAVVAMLFLLVVVAISLFVLRYAPKILHRH